MPYMHCPSCRLSSFSAAGYSSRDECPRCGTELTPQPRPLFVLPGTAPRVELPTVERPSSAA